MYININKQQSTFPGLTAYLFFWLRQNLLYKQPSLKKLNTAAVRIFSLLSLTLLVCSFMGLAFVFNRFQNLTMTSQVGCANIKQEVGDKLYFDKL